MARDITPKNLSKAATSDVVSAAEDPIPVCVSDVFISFVYWFEIIELLLVVVGYCVCETGVSVGFKLAEYTGFKHNRSHMSRLKKVDHYFSPLLVLGS